MQFCNRHREGNLHVPYIFNPKQQKEQTSPHAPGTVDTDQRQICCFMSRLLVIDCEMTGPKLTKHAMINLGATVVDLNGGKILHQLDLILNVPPGRQWDEGVKSWMLRQPRLVPVVDQVCKGQGQTVEAAMQQFVLFIKRANEEYGGDLVFGGDHLGEDCPWVNLYLSMCDVDPLHMMFGEVRHMVDICSYHQGCSRKTHKQVREFSNNGSGKKFSANIAAFKFLNIRDWRQSSSGSTSEYTHRAIDDSLKIAEGHYKVLKAIETLNEAYIPSSWMSSVMTSSAGTAPSHQQTTGPWEHETPYDTINHEQAPIGSSLLGQKSLPAR